MLTQEEDLALCMLTQEKDLALCMYQRGLSLQLFFKVAKQLAKVIFSAMVSFGNGCSLSLRYDGPTKGKRFFGCSYWPEQRTCGFFKWADEVDDVRDLQHLVMEKETRICELEYEMDMMKDKV
uniref:GRF-type domain-containing protein n=1 Tax=Chenopodium quinoa TaxID=63459 RepID=A0A803NEY2_CHEQI